MSSPLKFDLILPDSEIVDDVIFDISECLVDPDEEFEYKEPIISFEYRGFTVPVFRQEGVSMVQGPPKSRKSTLVSVLLSTILTGGYFVNGGLFKSYFPKNDAVVIDTEQSREDCRDTTRRINKISSKRINYYDVSDKTIDQRKYLVEEHLKNNPNCGYVVLDNIADFVTDINNTRECSAICNWIKLIKKNYGVHITVVLHENPSESSKNKARGHLGTYINNLSEMVIRVYLDTENENRSFVSAVFSRKMKFRTFCLELYDDLPHIYIDEDHTPFNKSKPKPKI